jgi:hypothetical protein
LHFLVGDLLSTLRIPVYPPDRSEWRKLELAMKFINISKTSVEQTKSRKESLKINPKDPELFDTDHEDSNHDDNFEVQSEKEREGEYQVKVSKSKKITTAKVSNWSKIRNSLHKIM